MKERIERWMAPFAAFVDNRTLLLVAGGGGLTLLADPAGFRVLMFIIPALLLFVGLGHMLRKVLMPYVDLSEAARRAMTSSIGAGYVVLGVLLFAAAVILAAAIWAK